MTGGTPGIQEPSLAHVLPGGTLRCQLEKGSPSYPVPSQQSLALNRREYDAGQTHFSTSEASRHDGEEAALMPSQEGPQSDGEAEPLP